MYRYIHIYIYDIIRQTATDQQLPFPAAVNCGPCVYHRPEMVGPRHLEPCRVAKKSVREFAGRRGEVLRALHGAGPVVSLQISR